MLEGELEKGTKKSNCLVGTNVLGRALHLPWKKKKGLWKVDNGRAVRAAGLLGMPCWACGNGWEGLLKAQYAARGKGRGKTILQCW